MAGDKLLGILFSDARGARLGGLNATRTMGAVPFAGRYRLADFELSRMSHAGADAVGIIMRSNYHSLMEHIGSGAEWDLSRKRGGVSFFPPYSSASAAGTCRGSLEALAGAVGYLRRSCADQVAVADCGTVSGLDLSAVLKRHRETGADLTLITVPRENVRDPGNRVVLRVNGEGLMESADRGGDGNRVFADSFLIRRELLIELIGRARAENRYSFTDLCLTGARKNGPPVRCHCHEGYCRRIDTLAAYYDASMALLDPDVRGQLFPRQRPVYTKILDEVPAKYGLDADVRNALIADGCIIEGTVRNSVLFRGVRVGRGAAVRDSVLLQGTRVGDGAELEAVICDKDVLVTGGRRLAGGAGRPLYVARGARV